MKIVKLSENIAVSEQITAEDMVEIAAAGYRVVVNNRPDNEVAGQPSSDSIEEAARAAGLEYHYLPVTASNFPGPDADRVAALFHDDSKPVLAFCRTGTRCANLWVNTADETHTELAREKARTLGYDLSMSEAAR